MNPKQFSLYLLKYEGDKFVAYANNDVPDKSLDCQIVLVLIFFFFFFFFRLFSCHFSFSFQMVYPLKGWLLLRHSRSCYANYANRCLTRPVSTDIVSKVQTDDDSYNQEQISSKRFKGKRT